MPSHLVFLISTIIFLFQKLVELVSYSSFAVKRFSGGTVIICTWEKIFSYFKNKSFTVRGNGSIERLDNWALELLPLL